MDKLDRQRAHVRMIGFTRTNSLGYEAYVKGDFWIQLTNGRWHVFVYESEKTQDENDTLIRELNEWDQAKHS